VAEQMGGKGASPERIESLQRKLEDFAQSLEPQERDLFSRLIDRDLLQAALQGRLDISRMRDDVGFWAEWAERQY
jgi:hypothetical protein